MAVNSSKDAPMDEASVSSPQEVPKPSASPEDEIRAVARKFSDQPVQNPDPGVWAVLTAISKNARQRPQGMNILLSAEEHCLGRCVGDHRFQMASISISGSHCRIFRDSAAVNGKLDSRSSMAVFLKDTSTNGTYLNWEKLKRNSPKARLKHGDIISFAAPPHDDIAYTFVYREVNGCNGLANGVALKRKSEDICVDSKRLKGIGIGAPEGPISLDDVRSLQRSNTELRQQLESHVLTIETMENENRATIARHENELKELKETVSNSYLHQVKELQQVLDAKQRELDELNALSAELRNSKKDLNERLSASMQSRADADGIIQSQKATISELEAQLDEERNQRRIEREKAEADLQSALQRAHAEAQEEIKRQANVYLKQHREQQEVISKLQDSEKENRLLVETLRSKLEDARESLVMSEKKVRQLEVQFQDEQIISANGRKKADTLESELRRLRKELENEKVAREEAWEKVSALELEISAAIRDLSFEKQRFQGARERIILRETQLRAFYSTTEEISALFAKQQEQLKAMQKTLEDEENTSIGTDLNEPVTETANAGFLRFRDEAYQRNNSREVPGASTPKNAHANSNCSDGDDDNDDDDASTTEKHDCELRSQDGNTQDLECTSSDKLAKGFGSDIDGIGTAVLPDGDPTDTEHVLGTESPAGDTGLEQSTALQNCSNLAGETMQLDDEANAQENLGPATGNPKDGTSCCSQSRMEDTETGTIRTADLLASEVAGSWAVNTAPSVNGENESPKSKRDPVAGAQDANADADCAAALLLCSEAAGSQSNDVHAITKLSKEQQTLNAMIEIVAPEFRQQFMGVGGGKKNESASDAETEGSNDGGGSDDDDTEVEAAGDAMEDDDDVMIEDSVG